MGQAVREKEQFLVEWEELYDEDIAVIRFMPLDDEEKP